MRVTRGVWRWALAGLAFGWAGGALAQVNELKIMAPAAPGGGWDQTARSMQEAMTAEGISSNVQVTNVPGAGGTIAGGAWTRCSSATRMDCSST